MFPGRHARSRRVLPGLAAFVLALGALVGLGRPASAIDPCYGYDLCVHVKLGPFDLEDGSGRVTSSPSGIDCHYSNGYPDANAVCDHYFHTNFATSITVSIHAVADAGSLVACGTYLPNVSSCDDSQTWTASGTSEFLVTFRMHPTVSVGIVGGGGVLSSPSGIQCTYLGGTCSGAWISQTMVTLTAVPATGFAFAGWQGFCAGAGALCSFTLTGDVDTTAVFQSTAPPPTPTPTRTPGPTGTPHPTASSSGGNPTALPGRSAAPGVSTPTTVTPGDPSASPAPLAASSGAAESSAAIAAAGSPVPADGAGAAGTAAGRDAPDLTPVLFAVLGAGLLVALSILAVGVMLRRRRDGPPA